MELRLRKIGKVKAKDFQRDFDGVYDWWKSKAELEHNYFGQLKFIKEAAWIFVYIELEQLEPNQLIDPENWSGEGPDPDYLDDII